VAAKEQAFRCRPLYKSATQGAPGEGTPAPGLAGIWPLRGRSRVNPWFSENV